MSSPKRDVRSKIQEKRIEMLEATVEALKASVDALLAHAGLEVVEADPFRSAFARFRDRAVEQKRVLREL